MQLLCLAAVWTMWTGSVAASQNQCDVVSVSRTPHLYPLPTKLTVRPLSSGWHMSFVLRVGEGQPTACVHMKEFQARLELTLYQGNCENRNLLYSGYLPNSIEAHAWTTLNVDVASDAVLVRHPQGGSVVLMDKGLKISEDGLQVAVTEVRAVEAMFGCDLGCPLQQYESAGLGLKKKVGEWQQENFYFYFAPGPSFSKLSYEVTCTEQKDTTSLNDLEIKLVGEDTTTKWHMVKLQKSNSDATVYLDDKQLGTIQLPSSCSWSMHVIWMVGDGSFVLSCTPLRPLITSVTQPPSHHVDRNIQSHARMHPGVAAAITLSVVIFVLGCVCCCKWVCREIEKD